MALTVRLDAETEHCLQELQAVSGLDRRSLISQLIREHWRLRRPVPTITELLDSPPPAFLGISKDFWRHTRAFQDILAEGRQEGVELGHGEGRRREASVLALRLLERQCGSIDASTGSRIEALSLPQLEELALALLDFRGAQDLQTWLEQLES